MMIDEGLVETIQSYNSTTNPMAVGKFTLLMDQGQYPLSQAFLHDEHIIIVFNNHGKKNVLKINLNFELILTLLRKQTESPQNKKRKLGLPYGLKLQRFNKSLSLINQNDIDNLIKWRDNLAKKINLRGFHQLFKPIKKIGKGNFASVYLVVKYQDSHKYAVKAFSKEGTYSEDKGKQSLINQIQITRKLNHKNLMKIHEIYQSQNSIYISVQLLEGGQLYDKIKSKYTFAPNEIKTVMRGILQGVQHMHSKKIMHRDLKPENILLKKQGQFECVIADFGLATFAEEKQYLFVRCGTPGYVAPQVVNLKDNRATYDPICDMFSVGVIFHMLVMKRSPFPGKHYNEVLTQNRNCKINFEADQYQRIPESWLNLMMRMLQKNPKNRITATQALSHKFFKDETSKKVANQQMDVQIENRKPLHMSGLNSDQQACDSPLMISKNVQRKNISLLRDDSCLKFKMKENLMTGRVDSNAQDIDCIDSPMLKKSNVVRKAQSRFRN